MPLTRPMVGLALTTVRQTVAENPADSGEMRTIEVVFVNVHTSETVTLVSARRAGQTTTRSVLPASLALPRGGTVTRILVLAPGDRIEAQALRSGDIEADVQQTFAEPV